MSDPRPEWKRRLEDLCYKIFGTHIIQIGRTGAGKTHGLYYLLEMLMFFTPNSVKVWFDRGKSSEILTIMIMYPVRLIHVKGTKINIQWKDGVKHQDVEDIEIDSFEEVWTNLSKDRVNIVSFRPFIRDNRKHAKMIGNIFRELLFLAQQYKVQVPMDIFYDEFQQVVPSKGDKFGVGEIMTFNLEEMRAWLIRFVVSTHRWNEMLRDVRSCFAFKLARSGTIIERDALRLKKYNSMFEGLDTKEGVFIVDDNTFSDPINMVRYPNGDTLGTITYVNPYERDIERLNVAEICSM